MTWIPEALSQFDFYLLVGTSFFTSFLTAAFGIGGGVTLLAVMSQIVPAKAIIPVHGIVQLGSNTGRTLLMAKDVSWALLAYFLAGSVVGALVGGQIVVALPTAVLQLVLAGFILFMIWGPKLKISKSGNKMYAVGGAFSTLLTMFVGATGPFVAASLKGLNLGKLSHVATLSASMVIQHLLKVVVFGFLGFAYAPYLPLMALMIASGFLGTIVGRRVLMRISENHFQHVLNFILTVLALRLVWMALAP